MSNLRQGMFAKGYINKIEVTGVIVQDKENGCLSLLSDYANIMFPIETLNDCRELTDSELSEIPVQTKEAWSNKYKATLEN